MSKHVMSCHVLYRSAVVSHCTGTCGILLYLWCCDSCSVCKVCRVRNVCNACVCVCTCTTLKPKDFECMQSKRSRGRRERHWQLSQRRLPVTGHENAPANERGGCTWVVVTACGPYEEFLGPSWQLESSPLGSASVFFRAELKASRI